MRDKVVLITGANSGVGFVTARELARQGARVLMLCRDPGRGAKAVAEVTKVATGVVPELLLADMSPQSAVRGVADEVRRRIARLDGLINNAGGLFGHRELTAEGIEKTFATNDLGAFLLTNLLIGCPQAKEVASSMLLQKPIHPNSTSTTCKDSGATTSSAPISARNSPTSSSQMTWPSGSRTRA